MVMRFLALLAAALFVPPQQTPLATAIWNGRPVVFTDSVAGRGDDEHLVVRGEQREADGRTRTFAVTTGEQEGGTPSVAAIGFANADRDPAKELIVILTWPVRHYDVEGTLYEVRILDDLKPGRDVLAPLPAVSKLFARDTCDCQWREGRRTTFGFKTIAAVKARLKRAGY